jgi:hypothetical protein
VGDNVDIDLIDVDGDGFSDVVVSFSGSRGPSVDWLLKWTGNQFRDLTPIEDEDGIKTSALRSAVVMDIDGDGVPEIVNATRRAGTYSDGSTNAEDAFEVYKLKDGVFQDAGTLVFYARFLGGGARGQSRTFAVNRTDITYTLTIINGGRGIQRVTKGSVTLNGVLIATASDFKDRAVSRSVHLANSDQLEVAIDGPHDQVLLVTIRPDVPYLTQPVVPKAQCVWLDGSGLFTASFGYENPNPSQIMVEIGDGNHFATERANRGQPVAFLPGVHDGDFWVQSNGETLTWILNGTTVNATPALTPCAASEPVSRASTSPVRLQ